MKKVALWFIALLFIASCSNKNHRSFREIDSEINTLVANSSKGITVDEEKFCALNKELKEKFKTITLDSFRVIYKDNELTQKDFDEIKNKMNKFLDAKTTAEYIAINSNNEPTESEKKVMQDSLERMMQTSLNELAKQDSLLKNKQNP